MKFTNTITIDRPPEAVFAYLADLEHLPAWNYALHETRKVTPGPVTVGTRYSQVRVLPVHRDESLEVIEYEASSRLTIKGTLNDLPALLRYRLQPDGETTTLTNDVELSVPGPLNLVAPLATHQVKSAVAANLEVLKQVLERK